MRAISIVVLGCAGSSAGQDLLVTLEPSGPDQYSIVAEFLSDPPPASTIQAVWADTHFELSGDGAAIEWVSTNPGYTSQVFGGPALTDGPTATFLGGQAGAPFGSPDPSNPLWVADFTYAGDAVDLTMTFLGINTGVFQTPLNPSGLVILSYTVAGQPGDATIEFRPIPAPATLAVLGSGALALRRRRSRPFRDPWVR